MAKSTFVDLVNANTATTGTGTMTLGTTVSGWRGVTALTNGATYSYKITDGSNYEAGQGVYTTSGTTMTRTAITESSNSGAAISLSGSATVIMTLLAADLRDVGRFVLLGVLKGANFNSTADQAIALAHPGTGAFAIAGILIANASTSLTTAKGTFYAAASKSNIIIASATATSTFQSLVASTDVAVSAMLAEGAGGFGSGAGQPFHFAYYTGATATIYLSLTTAQGGTATADIFVWGYDLT